MTASASSAAPNLSPAELWKKVEDRVKDRVNHRSLWEVMEKAVGIAIEGDTFIVGLNARNFNEAGHMNVSEHKNAIEQAASTFAGRPLKLRIIEGDTLADWVSTKQRDERVAAMRTATYERRDRDQAASQNWDTLYDYVSRAYSALPMRSLPQSKARYLTDMLYVIGDAMVQLYPENPDESADRMLARVIEKVASNAEVPGTLVALELERLRAWQRQNAG
jgi:hypothetical protein